MHKASLVTVISIFSFLLVSCSGTTKQYISPEVSGDYNNESVSLLVIDKQDFPDFESEHRFGELRVNELPVFNNHLLNLLRNATGANIQGQMRGMDLERSSFQVREFTDGGTDLRFMAPEDGTELKSEYESPRFVVMLDGFRFDTYEELVGGDSYAGHEPDVVPRITFETNYLIWDNDIQQAVAWGNIESDKVIELARIQEIYQELIVDSLQRMAEMSPFTQQRS